jgi:hypothetical protein
VVEDHLQLLRVLEGCDGRAPFFAELVEEDGHKLLIGLGGAVGCVQFSSANGRPPYLMALAAHPNIGREAAEFLCGGTATPVSIRYILPFEDIERIAIEFLQTGQRSSRISWEEI